MNKTSSPSRWLFVDTASVFGGHEVMLLRWLEELQAESSVEPRLLARDGRLRALAPQATRLPAIAPPRAGGRLATVLNAWSEWRALRHALGQKQPEYVVFASGALGSHLLLVILARMAGARVLVYVPLLDTFTSMGFRAGRMKDWLMRWIYSRIPQGWVTISERQACHFRDWARPSGHVFVLPNTVAREMEVTPRLMPQEIAPAQRLRVLVLGRLEAWQKGLDLLLTYLESAPAEVQDMLLVNVTGEGPYRTELERRQTANPALARCLVLSEWMSPAQAMATNDVLLIPSRFEGVPLVMLEAMALGLPVVASDLPGISAYVPAECLFAVGDIGHAARILRNLRDQELRNRLAARGRQTYETSASSFAFGQSVVALTRSLRNAFSTRHRPGQATPSLDTDRSTPGRTGD